MAASPARTWRYSRCVKALDTGGGNLRLASSSRVTSWRTTRGAVENSRRKPGAGEGTIAETSPLSAKGRAKLLDNIESGSQLFSDLLQQQTTLRQRRPARIIRLRVAGCSSPGALSSRGTQVSRPDRPK